MRFHIEDLLFGISRVADKDQIGDFGNLVCLLIFGCDPQGSDAHQLQLVAPDYYLLQVGVDYVDVDEQRHGLQLVLEVHIHQPVEQHSSHVLADIGLLLEVTRADPLVLPQTPQVPYDLLQIFALFFSFSFYGLLFHRTILGCHIVLFRRLVRPRRHIFLLFLRC